MTDARTCGNCQSPVTVDATFCPACGALLSAYESPLGAVTIPDLGTPAAITTLPATTTSPPATTPAPWAVRASTTPRPYLTSPTTPTTISPAPADPASDDLAAMAAPSDFAQSIEADLADARVVFDDNAHAVIATAPTAPDLDLTSGEPVGTTQPPAPTTTTRTPRTTTTRAPRTTTTRPRRTTTTRAPRSTTTRAPRPGATRTEFTHIELEPTETTRAPWDPDPNRQLNPPQPPAREPWRSTPDRATNQAARRKSFMASKFLIPAIVVGLIVINIAVRNPGFGIFLLAAAVLVTFLLRGAIGASKSSGRTTTRMPRDDRKGGK